MQSVKKPTPLPSPDLPDGWRWASISPLKHPTHSRPAGRRGPANSEAGPAICYSDAGGAKARHLRPGQSHELNTSRFRSVPSTEPDLSIGLYTTAATDPTASLPPSFPPFKKKKKGNKKGSSHWWIQMNRSPLPAYLPSWRSQTKTSPPAPLSCLVKANGRGGMGSGVWPRFLTTWLLRTVCVRACVRACVCVCGVWCM